MVFLLPAATKGPSAVVNVLLRLRSKWNSWRRRGAFNCIGRFRKQEERGSQKLEQPLQKSGGGLVRRRRKDIGCEEARRRTRKRRNCSSDQHQPGAFAISGSESETEDKGGGGRRLEGKRERACNHGEELDGSG